MGRNAIARTRHFSRSSVSDVFHIADEIGVTSKEVSSLSDQEVYRMFFPEKHLTEELYHDPDCEYVHKELTKKGVTLKLLWEEYRDKYKDESSISMGYTRFRKHYHLYTGGGIHADAILDRIVHNAVWLESGTMNMRAHFAKSGM